MTAIPITVLTGFLGSGKTTLLRRLLQDPAMAGTAVIINEFGDVGLDDALVEKADEDTILLPSGCVCCAVRGDLTKALAKLHRQHLHGDIPPIKRVVLETSGLADPTPIAHTLMTDEDTFRIYQLDGIVTTVDAQLGTKQIDEQFEPAKQIALADRIVITKSDLVAAADVAALEARVRALNRTCEILRIVKGDTEPARLIGLGAHEPALTGADPERWLGEHGVRPVRLPPGHDHPHDHPHDQTCAPDCGHDHHHDHHDHGHAHKHGAHSPEAHLHGVSTFALVYKAPLDGNALSLALQTLAAAYGDKLLRVKGIVCIDKQLKPFVVHGVQHIFYPPDVLKDWPKAADGTPDKRSRFVIIARDLPRETVVKHLKPFLGEPIA
jgi:G3E family GTPase